MRGGGYIVAAVCAVACGGRSAPPPTSAPGTPGPRTEPSGASETTPGVIAGTCFRPSAPPADPARRGAIEAETERLAEALADDGVDRGEAGVTTGAPPPARPVPGAGKKSTGAINRATVVRIIQSQRGRLQACYEAALRSDPDLDGRVLVRFTIDGNGRVSQATATGMIPAVTTCVERVFRRLRFPPPPSAPANIVYPILYRSDEDGDDEAKPAAPPEPERPTRSCGAPRAPPLTGDGLAPLERCLDEALTRDPGLGGRLVAHAHDGQVEAHGPGDEALAECAARALAPLTETATEMVCTYALINPEAAPSVPEAVRLDIGPTVTELDGSALLYTAGLREGDLDRARRDMRAKIERRRRASRSPQDTEAPDRPLAPRFTAVRAHPTIGAEVVGRAIHDLVRRSGLPSVLIARAVGTTDQWVAVNPLGTPDYRICAPDRASVRLRIGTEQIALGADSLALNDDGTLDRDALARMLGRARRTAASRSDLAIEAAPEVPYRLLATVLETAVEAGFFDARHRPSTETP